MLLTQVLDTADLARLSPDQRLLAESHLEGLALQHIISKQTIGQLGQEMKGFVAKLPANK